MQLQRVGFVGPQVDKELVKWLAGPRVRRGRHHDLSGGSL